MGWPALRSNGFVIDETAWNEVVASLSAWGGDVNAGGHNLSNLAILTFAVGGYIDSVVDVRGELSLGVLYSNVDRGLSFKSPTDFTYGRIWRRASDGNLFVDAQGNLCLNASSGANVGIHTSAPIGPLHISATDGTYFLIGHSNWPDKAYAAIGGIVNDGSGYTRGNLRFWTRPNAADAALTLQMEIRDTGFATFAGRVGAHDYSLNNNSEETNINGCPWHGIGWSNVTDGSTDPMVQLAGWGGVLLQTASGDLRLLWDGSIKSVPTVALNFADEAAAKAAGAGLGIVYHTNGAMKIVTT